MSQKIKCLSFFSIVMTVLLFASVRSTQAFMPLCSGKEYIADVHLENVTCGGKEVCGGIKITSYDESKAGSPLPKNKQEYEDFKKKLLTNHEDNCDFQADKNSDPKLRIYNRRCIEWRLNYLSICRGMEKFGIGIDSIPFIPGAEMSLPDANDRVFVYPGAVPMWNIPVSELLKKDRYEVRDLMLNTENFISFDVVVDKTKAFNTDDEKFYADVKPLDETASTSARFVSVKDAFWGLVRAIVEGVRGWFK
jgi:hypothetical protein